MRNLQNLQGGEKEYTSPNLNTPSDMFVNPHSTVVLLSLRQHSSVECGMHGTGARRYERPHNVFVGTGDSSFFQLPCPSAPLPQVPTGGTLKSSKIAQISCGATAAVALVVPVDTEDEPPLLLEWGTGLYLSLIHI